MSTSFNGVTLGVHAHLCVFHQGCAERDVRSATAATNCRVVGDMRWVERTLGHEDQMDALFRHEVNAGVWASRRPVYVLCFYDLNVFGGEVIVPMVIEIRTVKE